MLPLVVVIAALTLTSRPQQTTRLPLVAVIAALMLTSRNALRVSVVDAPEAVQATASLTMMSPLPRAGGAVIGGRRRAGTARRRPRMVLMMTLLVTSSAERVGAGDVAAGADGEVLRIDQPGAGDAGRRCGGDLGAVGDVDVRGGGFDEAAVAAVRCAGVERAGDRLTVPLCMSPSRMIVPSRLSMRARLDDAGVVDRGVEQLAGGLRGQQHLAAIGVDHAAVADQRPAPRRCRPRR